MTARRAGLSGAAAPAIVEFAETNCKPFPAAQDLRRRRSRGARRERHARTPAAGLGRDLGLLRLRPQLGHLGQLGLVAGDTIAGELLGKQVECQHPHNSGALC